MRPISVVILAGGASQRMGANKALLAIDGQKTLIAYVVEHMRALSDDLVLVTNTPELFETLGVRQVPDVFAGQGPLAGLHAGLRACANDLAFVMACDMPLIDHRLVRYMVVLSEGHDAVVPLRGEEFEPLHAVYSKACLPAVEQSLSSGQRRLIAFFPAVRIRTVNDQDVAIFDPEGQTFFNVNTPEDLEALKQLLHKGRRRRAS